VSDENVEHTVAVERNGPHVADCEACPAFATGFRPTTLKLFGWLHSRLTGHEVWLGQRIVGGAGD